MKKIIAIFLCLAAVSSCGFLDTEPDDFVTPPNSYNDENEINMALNGVYATLAESALYGGNMLGRMGLSADIGYESYSSDYGTVGDYDVSPSDAKILTYWREFYEGVNRANMLIKYVDKPGLEKEVRAAAPSAAAFVPSWK